MAIYKCGYCKEKVRDDIWCSEAHRQLWYEQERARTIERLKATPGRLGPKGRTIGTRRRTPQPRVK